MFRIMIISDDDEEDSGDEDDIKFTHAWYHFEDAIVFEQKLFCFVISHIPIIETILFF